MAKKIRTTTSKSGHKTIHFGRDGVEVRHYEDGFTLATNWGELHMQNEFMRPLAALLLARADEVEGKGGAADG